MPEDKEIEEKQIENKDSLENEAVQAQLDEDLLDQAEDDASSNDSVAEHQDEEHEDSEQDNGSDSGEVDQSPAQSASPAESAKGSGKGLAIFAILLALLSAAAAGFFGWQLFDQKRQLDLSADNQEQQTSSIAETVDRQFAEIATLRGELESWKQAMDVSIGDDQKAFVNLEKEVAESRAIIESHARRLLSVAATTTDDWRVAEVDYLLRLANQRLLISSDVATALELMEAADKILLELADPRLLPVRKAIADDSAALKLIAALDIDGMFLKLSALGKQVNSLPVISAPKFDAQVFSTESTSDDLAKQIADGAEAEGGNDYLDKILAIFKRGLNEIRGWLVINREDAQIKPMLPPEQQYYLRNNLKLLLNQAQIALLEKRAGPYQSSLENAVDWLEDYFPSGEPAIATTIKDLQTLSAIDIAPDVPDMSNSLMAIKGFINQRFSGSRPVSQAQPAEPVPSSVESVAEAAVEQEGEG